MTKVNLGHYVLMALAALAAVLQGVHIDPGGLVTVQFNVGTAAATVLIGIVSVLGLLLPSIKNLTNLRAVQAVKLSNPDAPIKPVMSPPPSGPTLS
jgi:hypothetical protein